MLPVVALSWGLALAAHGRSSRGSGLTWIHVALAFFLAVALLSVVLDARYLNQTLELDLSLKKLAAARLLRRRVRDHRERGPAARGAGRS